MNDGEYVFNEQDMTKIQIEGESQEFLMDQLGNIFTLDGQFVGTYGADAQEETE